MERLDLLTALFGAKCVNNISEQCMINLNEDGLSSLKLIECSKASGFNTDQESDNNAALPFISLLNKIECCNNSYSEQELDEIIKLEKEVIGVLLDLDFLDFNNCGNPRSYVNPELIYDDIEELAFDYNELLGDEEMVMDHVSRDSTYDSGTIDIVSVRDPIMNRIATTPNSWE